MSNIFTDATDKVYVDGEDVSRVNLLESKAASDQLETSQTSSLIAPHMSVPEIDVDMMELVQVTEARF